MYSIILVEDDSMQREILKKMLLLSFDFLNIYEADSESLALDIIKNNDIDLFLIDITLKDSSGLNLAMSIRSIPKYEFKQMVFLTTHIEYITQAFKNTHCYDYILKPYNQEEVQAMLEKLILHDIRCFKEEEKEISIKIKNGIYIGIKVGDILFVEVKGKNCEINTINGVRIINNMSLKKILQLIDSDYIIQSHKSFAINVNYISKIEKIDIRLSLVYFYNSYKIAHLGYKFRDNIVYEFNKGKVVVC